EGRAKAKITADTGAGFPTHEPIEAARQLAFVGEGIAFDQQLGDRQGQHTVPEKLQALVVEDLAFFGAFACMRQRALKHGTALELVAQSSFEAFEIAPSSHTTLINGRS